MDYWQHQKNEPLFPDVVWSRPVTKRGAGKLLIIGGSTGAMANVASVFASAEQSGAGTIHLLVPDSLAQVTKGIPHIQYAPSNPSGGFAKTALSEFLHLSENVDGVLLAGDMGKNSETSQLLELYLEKYQGLLAISEESLESFSLSYDQLIKRPETILFLNLNQLRALVIGLKLQKPVTSDTGRAQLAEILYEITSSWSADIVLCEEKTIWIASQERVADCAAHDFSISKTSIWAIQQPEKRFKALVSSCLK